MRRTWTSIFNGFVHDDIGPGAQYQLADIGNEPNAPSVVEGTERGDVVVDSLCNPCGFSIASRMRSTMRVRSLAALAVHRTRTMNGTFARCVQPQRHVPAVPHVEPKRGPPLLLQ